MEKWTVYGKRADFKAIASRFAIDQVIARVIRNRDIIGDEAIEEFLHGDIKMLHDPEKMKDLKKAADIIREKVEQKKSICVIGDYDVDGLMATYILVDGLRKIGANVGYRIPHRVSDGYGISEQMIDEAYQKGYDTIVTCDNGIAALDQIHHAKELGLTVIVTDHHQIKHRGIPEADAVVDPHQKDCGYPFSYLCGAGVAYKLVQQLFKMKDFPEKEMEYYIEYAGFATIEDSVTLTGENRIFAKEAMKRLDHTTNPGLRALKKTVGIEEGNLTLYHVGFVLGPCLNASGRLESANLSLELLFEKDTEKAEQIARQLKQINEERKSLTEQGQKLAEQMVETSDLKNDKVLVLFMPEVHESLAGLIANRIKDIYYRPTIVLTRGENFVKGSGRSISGYPLNEELEKCDELLLGSGGHPMAAGVSLEEKNIDQFRKKINQICTLEDADLIPTVRIDVPMPISYIRRELVDQLDPIGPFGIGNPHPLFAQKDLIVVRSRVVGAKKKGVKLYLSDGSGTNMEAIYFGDTDAMLARLEESKTITVAYYPTINFFDGRETIQLNIKHFC